MKKIMFSVLFIALVVMSFVPDVNADPYYVKDLLAVGGEETYSIAGEQIKVTVYGVAGDNSESATTKLIINNEVSKALRVGESLELSNGYTLQIHNIVMAGNDDIINTRSVQFGLYAKVPSPGVTDTLEVGEQKQYTISNKKVNLVVYVVSGDSSENAVTKLIVNDEVTKSLNIGESVDLSNGYTLQIYDIMVDSTSKKVKYGLYLKESSVTEDQITPEESPYAKDIQDEPLLKESDNMIIGYMGFNDPYSKNSWQVVKELVNNFDGEIGFEFRNYPWEFQDPDYIAAKAGECVLALSSDSTFFEYVDILMSNTDNDKYSLIDDAVTVGIGRTDMKNCMESSKMEYEVLDDIKDGQREKVQGTPTFYMDGNIVQGSQTYSMLKQEAFKHFSLQEGSQQEIQYYFITDDNSQSGDIILLTKLINRFEKEIGSSYESLLNSKVTQKDLNHKVTVFIYQNNALVIIGENSPSEHVFFANEVVDALQTEYGVTAKTKITSQIRYDDLRKEIELSYCTDTDGKDYYVKGKLYWIDPNRYDNQDITGTNIYEDVCENSKTLKEYICLDDEDFKSVETDCEYGCENGVCNRYQGPEEEFDDEIKIEPKPEPTEPTCYDNIENDGETGVDCGGPCKSCEEETECTAGCFKNKNCLPFGTRIIEDDKFMYCNLDNSFSEQKALNTACQNDYECETNTCSSGKCIDLNASLEKQQGLLEKIFEWLSKIFN